MMKTLNFTTKPLDFGPESSLLDFQKFLVKFPKNSTQLHFSEYTLQSKNFIRRIKQLKMIRSLHFIKSHRSHLKVLHELFKTHRYSIKQVSGLDELLIPIFPKLQNYELDIPDENKLLTFTTLCQIKHLTLNILPELIDVNEVSEGFKQRQRRFWIHLNRLKTLKSLQINCQDYKEFTDQILSTLNEMFEVLEALDSLVLNFTFPKSNMIAPQDFSYKNILNFTTKIELHDTMIPASHYLLDQIDRCPHLRFLSAENIKFGKLSEYLRGYSSSINFQPFKSMYMLNQLRVLDISVGVSSSEHLMTFFGLFVLPESIETLRLVLQRVKWSCMLEDNSEFDQSKRNPFENNDKCVEFYNKWKKAKNLKFLELKFELTETEQPIPTAYFVVPLLRNISALETLDYINNVSWNLEQIGPLNLQALWKSLDHLRPSLRKVWIEDKLISLKDFKETKEEWSHLKDLIITGSIEDDGFSHLVNIFKRSDHFGKVDCSLSVKELIIKDDKAFGECLKALARKPAHLYAKLFLNVAQVSVATIMKKLCKFIEKSEANGSVYLILLNAKKIDTKDQNTLDEKLEKRKVFENLKITMKNPFFIYDFLKRMANRYCP